MKKILNRLSNNQILSREEAREVLIGLATGQYNNSQIAAFLTIYLMRAISVQELRGFKDAMLELCNTVSLEGYNTIDVCGTGGDGKNTFNVSTASSFVVAGAGVNVAKHGNYGVSSVSGSSNILELLGVKFSGNPDQMIKSIDKAGICFMHAPLFHPAMKNVGPVRRELGVKTFFNMLGPMVNPACPPNQMVGVFSLELARLYGYLYQNSTKQYAIIHSLDGYDEISLTGEFKLIANKKESLVSPSDLGLSKCKQEDLYGGETVKDATHIFHKILSGHGSKAQNEVVIANAGLAIATAKKMPSLDAVEEARVSLQSGRAMQAFQNFVQVNN